MLEFLSNIKQIIVIVKVYIKYCFISNKTFQFQLITNHRVNIWSLKLESLVISILTELHENNAKIFDSTYGNIINIINTNIKYCI